MSDAPSEGANNREIAYRLFAAEYDESDLSYSEGDQERAPNYVVTPTGARVNRAFFVGVLTEVEAVSEDVLRARVVDPTGAFVLYAGQYQPDEQAFLESADTPTFVAVTGKARTFQPEDADQIYTSIRPETINEVDTDTRDRWTVAAAERTLQRVGWIARAIASDRQGGDLETALVTDGADEGFASGIVRALDHYRTSPAYLSAVVDMALDAARVVAGEIDEVQTVSVSPDAPGEADLDTLAGYADLATVHGEESGPDTAVAETSEPEPAGDDTTGEEESADVSAGAATATTGGTERPTETEAAGSGVDGTGSNRQDAADETTAEVGDFEPGEFDLDDEEREEIEAEFGTEFQSGSEVDEPGAADIDTPEPETSAARAPAEETDSTTAVADTPAEPPVAEESELSGIEDGESSGIEDGDGSVDAADPTADADEPAHEAADSTEAAEAADSTEAAEAADSTEAAEAGETDSERAAASEAETDTAAVDPDDVDLEGATLDAMSELDDGTGADRQVVIETVTDRHGVDPEAVEEAIQDALMDGRCYEPDDASLKPI